MLSSGFILTTFEDPLPVHVRLRHLLLVLTTVFGLASAAIEARLPNGRTIAPEGDWHALAPYPFALAVRADGLQVILPSLGWPFSLNIVDRPGSPDVSVTRIPATTENDPAVEVHAGIAYSSDGRTLYDATGNSGAVDLLSIETRHWIARISLDGDTAGVKYAESFAANLVLSGDGRFLYVLDQANWRVVVIDVNSRERIASVPTGANPLAMALSADGRRLHVTNSGLFEYQLVKGVKKEDTLHTGLRFTPFGYPSKQARRGGRVDGHQVPGLGDENDVRGSSLWTYTVDTPAKPVVSARLRLGIPITTRRGGVVGGASPSGVLADAQHVYVSLAHDDVVAVITPDGARLERQIEITPFTDAAFRDHQGRPLRGVMPVGLAQDAQRLYVTEAGINAVAVIDKASSRVLGHRAVGWYPSAAAVSPDGRRLYVVNTKGKGTGPNGGKTFRADAGREYIAQLAFGSLSVLRLDTTAEDLARSTEAVLRNNKAALVPDGKLPRLKHVYLIIRENRTYDEVFGDLPEGDGDPTLARYGMKGWAAEDPNVRGVRVTPNAHALARRFAGSDRFFVDSDVSADGHRWAVGIAPTPWMNMAWTSGYGGRRESNPFSATPGRRALGGGADGPMPEDEPQYGSLWEHIAGAGLSIRNYGEGLELEGADESEGKEPEGQRLVLNAPVPKPVFESTDRSFPTFNLGIPDQFRYTRFAKDMDRRLAKGKIAALTVIRLCNDHTADPRPQDGYPYRASYIADNDLALGRIVEKISHSARWQDSAIFVIEDDAQDGADHVDAHRSVLLVMSPWERKGFLSHRHCSMPGVQKTIYELLGLGPLNLEDALAADMSDLFADRPDPTPFTAEASDPRIFDPARARFAKPKTKAEAARLRNMDNPAAIQAEFDRTPPRDQEKR